MGFNKRFISKETIELALTDLNRILNSDMIIIRDEWSEKFIDHYQKLLKKLDKENKEC